MAILNSYFDITRGQGAVDGLTEFFPGHLQVISTTQEGHLRATQDATVSRGIPPPLFGARGLPSQTGSLTLTASAARKIDGHPKF